MLFMQLSITKLIIHGLHVLFAEKTFLILIWQRGFLCHNKDRSCRCICEMYSRKRYCILCTRHRRQQLWYIKFVSSMFAEFRLENGGIQSTDRI